MFKLSYNAGNSDQTFERSELIDIYQDFQYTGDEQFIRILTKKEYVQHIRELNEFLDGMGKHTSECSS